MRLRLLKKKEKCGFELIWMWYLCRTQVRLEQAETFPLVRPQVETLRVLRQSPEIFLQISLTFYRAPQQSEIATVKQAQIPLPL